MPSHYLLCAVSSLSSLLWLSPLVNSLNTPPLIRLDKRKAFPQEEPVQRMHPPPAHQQFAPNMPQSPLRCHSSPSTTSLVLGQL